MIKKEIIKYKHSNNIYDDITSIVNQAKDVAYKTVNVLLVQRNWLLGKRIAEEELKDNRKENYGKEIIVELSKKLTREFGKGFEKTNLYYYLQFYNLYPNIFDSMSGKSFLSWTHYRILLQVISKEARDWYEKEALSGSWSVRTLQRNVSSDYYHRMILSQKKELVKEEMLEITEPLQDKKLEFIKNPMVLEFLGIPENNDFREYIREGNY